jgi:membrane protease YdiL (CAAX protease family)
LEPKEAERILCSSCENPVIADKRYCTFCGRQQNQELPETTEHKWLSLKQAGLFFGLELLYCAAAMIIKDPGIATALSFDILMAVSAVIFFSLNWQENKYLLKWPNFSILKLLAFIVLSVLGSLLVTYLVGNLNRNLFNQEFSYYDVFRAYDYGAYILYVSVALFPALFEELAFRGYLMQKLLNVFGKKETIYITSILFFFIHFSMVSFFWMLPFAILLAYVRIKENTLWYGVVLHFFFNFTVCLTEVYGFDWFY